ncbi:hypothetical protein [Nocardioides sp.]|uniref:hypothetical protein n=1 Tax=Nocardioides sp. TaxID=35761 RepID=UPI0031FE69CC
MTPYSWYVPAVCGYAETKETTMTWKSFHNRGEILRAVIATADARRDGILPLDVEGVSDTFGDELTLLGALQLRWHTRLAGRIERELMHQPLDLEQSVIDAWRATADELPGIRAIVDHYRSEPQDAAMAEALAKSIGKEHILLAIMAGQANVHDTPGAEAARRAGARIEERARATRTSRATTVADLGLPAARGGLLERLKAALAA